MSPQRGRVLADLTTLRLGGPAAEFVEVAHPADLRPALTTAPGDPPPVLIGGGSNLVIADAGIPGRVVRIATTGVVFQRTADRVRVTAAAGESWDGLVAASVAEGLAGIETLTGIPGTVGATPYQNVGAYGRDVGEVITEVVVHDGRDHGRRVLTAEECEFGYRTSRFRRSADEEVITEVTVTLDRSPLGLPIRYPDLAAALDCPVGARVPLAEIVAAVRQLRRQRGMLIDPADPDSRSVGSFFVNPVLSAEQAAALPASAPRWPHGRANGPAAGQPVKTSAAWLIEQSGFTRGTTVPAAPGVRVSTKHTLALVNLTGTTAALLHLAGCIRDGVRERFGITLDVEPRILGTSLPPVSPTRSGRPAPASGPPERESPPASR